MFLMCYGKVLITKKRRDYETDYIYISCRYDEYSCL